LVVTPTIRFPAGETMTKGLDESSIGAAWGINDTSQQKRDA